MTVFIRGVWIVVLIYAAVWLESKGALAVFMALVALTGEVNSLEIHRLKRK